MQEPHSEGVANQADLELCAGGGDIAGEALTEALASRLMSREILSTGRRPCGQKGKAISLVAQARAANEPGAVGRTRARQETLCTRTGRPPRRSAAGSRPVGEGASRTTYAYVTEESDRAVVPVKGPNKGGEPAAEGLEGRAWAKENAGLPRTVCTPRQGCGVTAAAWVRSGGAALRLRIAIIRGRSRMS
jgi:hypothetical protein